MAKKDFISGYRSEDRIVPVITVTLYWGAKPWDGPESLSDMLVDIDPALKKYINDYKLNLFSIIDMEYFPKFHSELRELFILLNARNDANKMQSLVQKDKAFEHINRDTAELIREFASV